MEEQDLHQLEMVIEASEDKIEVLKWCLKARLFDKIAFYSDGQPRLKITRIHNLWHAKKVFHQSGDVMAFAAAREIVELEDTQPDRVKPRCLRLRLPKHFRDVLVHNVAEQIDGHTSYGYYLRMSDTKDRFFRAIFFKETEPVLHARIEHADQIGAMAAITKTLRDGGFSVISALRSPCEATGRSWLEVVVRGNSFLGKDSTEKQQELERTLSSSEASSDLTLEIGYPTGYGNKWDKRRLPHVVSADATQVLELRTEDDWQSDLTERVTTHYQSLTRKKQVRTLDEQDKNRWMLADELARTSPSVTRRWDQKVLFVSCHFSGDDLRTIEDKAATRQFRVQTGKSLHQYPDMVSGLKAKMDASTHFLGVWSIRGAYQAGSSYWPSPWLLWELGMAHSLGLVWRLLIEDSITREAWRRLQFAQQHFLFDSNFESQLDSALDVLAALPPMRIPAVA